MHHDRPKFQEPKIKNQINSNKEIRNPKAVVLIKRLVGAKRAEACVKSKVFAPIEGISHCEYRALDFVLF
jgi:hypothetical protein